MHVEKEKIYPAYVSKHNSNREKQDILLLISNREKWHYLAVKNYQHCYEELHQKRLVTFIIMPFEDTKILEFNQYQRCDRTPFIIYADLECIIQKVDGCKNNTEN